jgi:hypothetical protein
MRALPVFFPLTGCALTDILIGTRFGSDYDEFRVKVNAEVTGAHAYSCALNESKIDEFVYKPLKMS